ncbi:MAG TPA: hypothetical protein VNW47_15645 [Terriglobales bacterium]|jgi:hypothetical protein|nr:hypothetical protein [Terriglobales bacterium]
MPPISGIYPAREFVAPPGDAAATGYEIISSVACRICNLRKEKRFCPAVHGRICPQCCGEQREVTLECPSDCPYLLQAREHEKPRDRSQIDQAALFPDVEIGDQFIYEHEHLLVGLSFALAKSARANRTLADRDLIAALTSLAKSYETLVNSSLIVGQRTTNLDQQAIATEIENLIKEYRETEQQHTGLSRLRDSDLLKALVFLVRLGLARTSGRPKSRAFVDFLFAQFPENQSALAAPDEAASRIIVP